MTAAGVSLALLTNPSSPMGLGPRKKDPCISMQRIVCCVYLPDCFFCKETTLREWYAQENMGDWCIERGLWLSTVHIPGTINVKVDALSRRHYSGHKWMHNNDMFSRLCKIFPGLTIDLFASALNHRLPHYVSWGHDS